MQLVHQKAFSCTKSTIQGGWYTRWPFPVQNPRLKAVGTPESLFLYKTHDSRRWYTRRPFPVPTPRFNAVGTPDGLFLYQLHDSMQLVHQTAFSCTKPTIQCSWYTRKPFPVPNPRFKALVHQTAFPVQTPRFKAVGTPDGLFLYKTHDSRRLVHQKAFSCTNSTIQCSWYTRKPFPVPNPIIKLSKR